MCALPKAGGCECYDGGSTVIRLNNMSRHNHLVVPPAGNSTCPIAGGVCLADSKCKSARRYIKKKTLLNIPCLLGMRGAREIAERFTEVFSRSLTKDCNRSDERYKDEELPWALGEEMGKNMKGCKTKQESLSQGRQGAKRNRF